MTEQGIEPWSLQIQPQPLGHSTMERNDQLNKPAEADLVDTVRGRTISSLFSLGPLKIAPGPPHSLGARLETAL